MSRLILSGAFCQNDNIFNYPDHCRGCVKVDLNERGVLVDKVSFVDGMVCPDCGGGNIEVEEYLNSIRCNTCGFLGDVL